MTHMALFHFSWNMWVERLFSLSFESCKIVLFQEGVQLRLGQT